MKASPEDIERMAQLAQERGGTVKGHFFQPEPEPLPAPPKARSRARHVRGTMNQLETRYAKYLDNLKAMKIIQAYWFERITFRLAQKTTYTPDFMVILVDGLVEFHEVKGFWEHSARVKIKVAAQLYWPFTFLAVKEIAKKRGGGWEKEMFNQ